MRTKSVIYYYLSSTMRSLIWLAAVLLVVSIVILGFMTPYARNVEVNEITIGDSHIVQSKTDSYSPSLSEPFGTPVMVYSIYMLVLAVSMITHDRKYLLSHPMSRYELVLGNFVSVVALSGMITATRYVLDVFCRLATMLFGINIVGKPWSLSMVLFASNTASGTLSYFGSLLSDFGGLIFVASGIALTVLLFTRWKKTCITLCVASVVLPVMLLNFLPRNWIQWLVDNANVVFEWLTEFFNRYNWIFMYNIPGWQAMLQYLAGSVVTYGLIYLVLRRMTIKSKA